MKAVLRLTVAAAWFASCSSSVQSVSCGGWNTAEFFRTASLETVTVCLGQGADVGPQGAAAMTPLHWAAGVGAPSPVVDVLIAHGGDPNAREHVGGESVDIERIIKQQGVTIVDRELSDRTIRAVAIDGERHRPGILVNSRNSINAHPFGRRFTLAHEFCHLLFDRDVGAHLAIASGPWAPQDVERRANAFAAMFLMPNELVRRAVSALAGSLETKDAVHNVANRLQTGFESTLWHLKNLGYIDDVTRQRIENEALQQQPEETGETTGFQAEHMAVATGRPRRRRVRTSR